MFLWIDLGWLFLFIYIKMVGIIIILVYEYVCNDEDKWILLLWIIFCSVEEKKMNK